MASLRSKATVSNVGFVVQTLFDDRDIQFHAFLRLRHIHKPSAFEPCNIRRRAEPSLGRQESVFGCIVRA